MKKINLTTFYHELMGLGIASELASRVVTLCDVMQRDGSKKDRERSAAYRRRKKLADELAAKPALTLTASISSSEVKGNAKEVSKKGRKRSNKIPLPEDFAPTDAHYAKAASLGCSPAFVLSKFEDLKNWALSNDVRKADWSATLHGFIRRDAEKGLQHGQPNYGQTLRTAVSQLKSGGVTAIQPAGSGTGARPALRLISAGEGDQP